MTIKALVALGSAGILLASGVAMAASSSAFQKPRAAVKAAISAKFACSWRPYLDASEQCGDELVVLNAGTDGAVESVELTCPIRPRRNAAACQARAAWLIQAFVPSWSAGRRWVADVFRSPPRPRRSAATKIEGKTVLAETEGPEDASVANMVIGVTRGDPQAWDLPR